MELLSRLNFTAVFLNMLLVVLIAVIWKKTRNKKLSIGIPILICFTLAMVTGFIYPLENLFVRFKSPESVFNYSTTGDIDMVVEGSESCMIVYSQAEEMRHLNVIFPRRTNGYIIPTLSAREYSSCYHEESDGIYTWYQVYSLRNISDYYIKASMMPPFGGDEIQVVNNSYEVIGVLTRLSVETYFYDVGGSFYGDETFFYGYIDGSENDINDIYVILDGEKTPIAR